MVKYFDIGDIVRSRTTFTDTGSNKKDPSQVEFVYTTPDGADTVISGTGAGIKHPSTGFYYFDVLATASGPYWARFSSTGNVTTAAESVYRVRKRRTDT